MVRVMIMMMMMNFPSHESQYLNPDSLGEKATSLRHLTGHVHMSIL